MPAAKAAQRAAQRAAINQPHRTRARTMVARARRLILAGDWEAAEQALRQAESALDRAAVKGVIHKNNAARRKGRLWQQLHKQRTQEVAQPQPKRARAASPRRTQGRTRKRTGAQA